MQYLILFFYDIVSLGLGFCCLGYIISWVYMFIVKVYVKMMGVKGAFFVFNKMLIILVIII